MVERAAAGLLLRPGAEVLLELELLLILLIGESGGVVLLLLVGVGAPGTVATG